MPTMMTKEQRILTTRILDEILKERMKHIDKGFTPNHDARHTQNELAGLGALLIIRMLNPDIVIDTTVNSWVNIEAEHLFDKYKYDQTKIMLIAAACIVAQIEQKCRDYLSNSFWITKG